MHVKKIIWQPLVIGLVFGLLAGIAMGTGLSFLTPGITENAVGFYGALSAALCCPGGPAGGRHRVDDFGDRFNLVWTT